MVYYNLNFYYVAIRHQNPSIIDPTVEVKGIIRKTVQNQTPALLHPTKTHPTRLLRTTIITEIYRKFVKSTYSAVPVLHERLQRSVNEFHTKKTQFFASRSSYVSVPKLYLRTTSMQIKRYQTRPKKIFSVPSKLPP